MRYCLIVAICAFSTAVWAQTKARKSQTRTSEPESRLDYEIALNGLIDSKTSEDQYSESTMNRKTTSKGYRIIGGIYKIFGDFEAGPTVTYYRSDSSYTYDDPSRVGSSRTDIHYGGGVVLKYNFADLQTASLVPFTQISYERTLNYLSGSMSSNSADFGLGMSWFLARNIAFTPIIKYSFESGETSNSDYWTASKNKDSGIEITWGLSNFI